MEAYDQWFVDKRKKSNVLNGLDLDVPVYRIFSSKRLFQLFKDKQLTLLKPHKWDDPFENFLYSSKAQSLDGVPMSLDNLRETVFGQCWSLDKESDAMWRIYSHDKDGIKVKTTARRLYETFWKATSSPVLQCYIGKVLYWSENKIQQMFNAPKNVNAIILNSDGLEQARTFFIKREEFAHEHEVRLLYTTTPDQPECKSDTFSFPVDPCTLFDEIVVDPRMDQSSFDALADNIRHHGFGNPIYQSSLYRIPNFNVTLNISLKQTSNSSTVV